MHMRRRIRPRIFGPRSKYASHRPVEASGMFPGRRPWPQSGRAVSEETPAGTAQQADGGELTASPWIGLYYRSEWS
jgi:hypothetical protein